MLDFKKIISTKENQGEPGKRWKLLVAMAVFCILLIYIAWPPQRKFIVVLDPGHGGKNIPPYQTYGDKYNPLAEEYVDYFREGTSSRGLYESEEVYSIALMVKKILALTGSDRGRELFHRILKKYTADPPFPEDILEVKISRPSGYRDVYFENREDINAPFRMFDYPHIRTGQIMPGRLSRINALNPDLVVSIHLNGGASPKGGEMGAVITPSYHTFAMALDYVKGNDADRKRIQKQFYQGPYKNWITSCNLKGNFSNFLCDAWIYFTGYWSLQNGLKADSSVFRGYRHNMLTWKYADPDGWVEQALQHPGNTPYASDLKYFKPESAFWTREKSEAERFKREGGLEGYGGDNLYAGNEILRFVRKGLLINNIDTPQSLPELKPPYLSTSTVPTYLNAINADLELGFGQSKSDYNRILNHKKVYAESIAVGIYSLFRPVKAGNAGIPDMPKGEAIEWQKYHDYHGSNYFEEP